MRIAIIIVRVLMGLMFLFASISFFFHLFPEPKLEGDVKIYMDGISTVQMMTIVKSIELICGIAFITGRYVALAAAMIFPIIINILLFHAYLGPADILIPILLLLGNVFLFYAYRKNYSGVLASKRME